MNHSLERHGILARPNKEGSSRDRGTTVASGDHSSVAPRERAIDCEFGFWSHGGNVTNGRGHHLIMFNDSAFGAEVNM